jgi:phosphatidylglycerol:prolipoprotein diacylglycerol transferase
MYPELFTIPGTQIVVTSFGVMLATGFIVAYRLTAARMKEVGLDPEIASSLLLWIMIGGVLGSKLYFAFDNWLRGMGDLDVLLLSRGGITWYGGLIGGILAGSIGSRVHNLSIKQIMDCAAVATAIGQSLGRVGCFLVGDDYGKPTDVAWGMSFPQGQPPTGSYPDGSPIQVHPTQVYEIMWLLPVAFVLYTRRNKSPFLFGEYLAANGLGRIVIEHWRINPRVALGMTEPQWIGVALMVSGVLGWLYYYQKSARADPSPSKTV